MSSETPVVDLNEEEESGDNSKEETQNNASVSVESSKKKKKKKVKRRRTSDVWDFFDEFPINSTHNKPRARCKACKATYLAPVASESTFSGCGHVIDHFRSSLKPNIVEALICTRDWLYGEEENTQMMVDDLIEDVFGMTINDSSVSSIVSGSNSKDISISSGSCSININ